MWNEFKERFIQWFEKIKALFLEEAQENFYIYGVLKNRETEEFIPNKEYEGFVIQRKKL